MIEPMDPRRPEVRLLRKAGYASRVDAHPRLAPDPQHTDRDRGGTNPPHFLESANPPEAVTDGNGGGPYPLFSGEILEQDHPTRDRHCPCRHRPARASRG